MILIYIIFMYMYDWGNECVACMCSTRDCKSNSIRPSVTVVSGSCEPPCWFNAKALTYAENACFYFDCKVVSFQQ